MKTLSEISLRHIFFLYYAMRNFLNGTSLLDLLSLNQHHSEWETFPLAPTTLSCTFVVIIIIIFLVLGIKAIKNNYMLKNGLKRKFETIQDETPPMRDVNLMCSNTVYHRVNHKSGFTTVVHCLFIYDGNDPGGDTLKNLCSFGQMGYRYPLGVEYYGYIKFFDSVRNGSQNGLYPFEGGECTLNPAKLLELQSRGSVYSGFVHSAPALPLYPILRPRDGSLDPSRMGVYLRSWANQAPMQRQTFSDSDSDID